MMRRRYLASLAVLAGMLALLWLALVPIASQEGTSLRTPWGDPDLQGIWHVTADVPLERPAKYAGRAFLTDEEVAALDQAKARNPGKNASRDVDSAYNSVFDTVLRTGKRTSLIIDPPDGKIPPLTAEGQTRWSAAPLTFREIRQAFGRPVPFQSERYDNPETIPMDGTRCLGIQMPALGVGTMRLVQSPKAVGIYIESSGGGATRVISVNGSPRPHIAAHIRPALGDSSGRWEGNTLVVETTNVHQIQDDATFKGTNTETFRMIERFTRVDANQLRREMTFEDSATWTRPWTVLIELGRSDDQRNLIFESTCHEGNYGMTGILAGVRAQEEAEAAKQRSAK